MILHGRDPQLESLCWRAGITCEVVEADDQPWAELPGGGVVVVTRGRTAQQESLVRGRPVAVVDRCLDPMQTTGIAFTAADAALGDAVEAWLTRAGVRSYRIADAPGLVLGRVLSMIANEAWETVHTGVATREDIDVAMVLGTSYPMGPFEWCEAWGVTTVLDTLDTLWSEYHDARYRASQALRSAARAVVGSAANA